MNPRAALLITLALASGCRSKDPYAIESMHRDVLAEGVELVTIELARGSTARIVYADAGKVRPALTINERKQRLAEIQPGALAVVNASFFTPNWKPTGLLVSSGHVYNRFVKEAGSAGSGVFVLEDGQLRLVERDEAEKGSFDECTLAIQAGPRVIEGGGAPGIRSDDGIRVPRTFIGADAIGRLAVGIIVDPGLSLFELQHVLGERGLGRTQHPKLRFKFALNLDGGPSTGMHVRHGEHGFDRPEVNPVYSILSLRPRR